MLGVDLAELSGFIRYSLLKQRRDSYITRCRPGDSRLLRGAKATGA